MRRVCEVKFNQFRRIERNERRSGLVVGAGLNIRHPRETVGNGTFVIGLLVGQFEIS